MPGRSHGIWGLRRSPLALGLCVAVVLVLLAAVGVSILEVARPESAEGVRADAVAVHAANPGRLDAGIELVEAGVAPVLVISDVGHGYGRTAGEMAALCARRRPYEVLCVRPEPANTLGEARAFGRLAAERGWRTVVVVTNRRHLARARLAVGQCIDGRVLGVASDPDRPTRLRHVRGEWLRVTATVTGLRAC